MARMPSLPSPSPVRSHRAIRRAALLAGGLLLAGFTAQSASAQIYVRPFALGGTWRGDIIEAPIPRGRVGLHPSDIILDLEERGYHSMRIAGRRPGVLIIDGMSRRNEPVRLVVDRYDGDILERYARDGGPRRPPMPDDLSPRRESRPKKTGPDRAGEVAEIPAPPRRPAEPDTAAPPTAAPTPDLPNRRPAPVAPARDPSLWAPKS